MIRLARCALVLALALTPAASARALPVLGFQEDGTSVRAIDRSAAALRTIGVDGINLLPAGNAVSAPVPDDLRQLVRAHRDHLRAVLLIGNWDNSINDFSERLAHRLLGDPAAIAAVAQSIAQIATAEGWDGVNIDLESLTARDSSGLTSFMTALRADLAPPHTISIDIQLNTRAADYGANGYNLAAIAQHVDQLVLMAYDEHGPWERQPGPVGALSWQRAGLKVMLQSVPAAKVDFGVAGYGYVWGRRTAYMVSDLQARALVTRQHARPRWSRAAGEWTAKLPDGSTVWWSDARSYRLRAGIAQAQHLHGLAVWSLGLSDPIR